MAVTTPEVLRPDSLTVTISQVPGVSSTWETGWGGKEVEAQPVSGEDNCPCSSASLTVLGRTLQLSTSCSPGHCCPLVLKAS